MTVENGLTPKTARYNRSFLVKKNDKFKTVNNNEFIYNPMNMTLGAVDLNSTGKTVAVSGYYITMITKPNFDSKYFNFWLKSAIAIKNYKIYATGSLIERQRIQFPTLSQIKTKVPSISEQQRIGNILMKLDRIITLHQRKINILKLIKDTLLKKLFAQTNSFFPELRFNSFKDEWKKSKLSEFVKITTGKLDANAMVENGEFDFYTSGVKKYKIDHYAFEGPAITIAGNGATVGHMHYADGLFNAYQRTYVLSDFTANREFLYQAISLSLPEKIRKEARTGNIPYIVLGMLTDLELNITSIDEQKKIGYSLEELNQYINLYQRKVTIFNNLKRVYLRKIFL